MRGSPSTHGLPTRDGGEPTVTGLKGLGIFPNFFLHYKIKAFPNNTFEKEKHSKQNKNDQHLKHRVGEVS